MENLISNAIKYGAADSPVTVTLQDLSDKVRISVHNFGNPLSDDERTRIFDQFKRSKAAEASGKKGWGIGLTIVRGLTEAHGGSITVESSQETGTTFAVTLPRDARAKSDAEIVS
jgi:signal transduction histidine kinase